MSRETGGAGMRIIILNQFFHPDHSATSQLMTELAESLVELGHSVTALAGRGRYTGGGRLPVSEDYQGVRITRAWATSFGKRHLWGRLADYLSFYIGATWKLLRLPHHDVVLALTTPPLIGLVALLVGRLRRMRVVVLVQDVYPEIAIALGKLPADGLLTRLLDGLNGRLLRQADGIIVLSECMRRRLAARIGDACESRLEVIHNWADGSRIQPQAEAGKAFALDHNLAGAFIVLFSGNWGEVNEFRTVLEAARSLRERRDIAFLFIGDGSKAAGIRQFCEQHELKNVRLLPYQPRERVPATLAACDAALVTLAEGLAGLSVPSKTYAILAAGRPVLYVGDQASEIADIVRENACGATVAAGESQQLAELITAWATDLALTRQLGERARAVFESRFDRPAAVRAYVRALQKFLRRSPQVEPEYGPGEVSTLENSPWSKN